MTDQTVEYSKITPDRYDDVIVHLRNNFFADEPLNRSLRLSLPGKAIPELEEYSYNMMRQGMSSMATAGEEVVGAVLLGRVSVDLKEYQNPKLAKIFSFIGAMAKTCNYGDDVEEQDIIDLKILSVDGKMRGMGIGSRLYEIAEQTVIDKGYKIIRAEATALSSQKILSKYGWNTLREVLYNEYPNSENPDFLVDGPNKSFKIMIKRIDLLRTRV